MQNFVDELTDMISILENKHSQRAKIYEWIEEENNNLRKLKEKPTRINIEATAQEITNLNEMLQNINEKKIETAELVSDDLSDKLVNDLDLLTDMVINLLIHFPIYIVCSYYVCIYFVILNVCNSIILFHS